MISSSALNAMTVLTFCLMPSSNPSSVPSLMHRAKPASYPSLMPSVLPCLLLPSEASPIPSSVHSSAYLSQT
eukprot:5118652-Ditylum_brightwellii.AAC.1